MKETSKQSKPQQLNSCFYQGYSSACSVLQRESTSAVTHGSPASELTYHADDSQAVHIWNSHLPLQQNKTRNKPVSLKCHFKCLVDKLVPDDRLVQNDSVTGMC